MIAITKDQEVAENPNLRVMTPAGDYEDTALIEFYDNAVPGTVVGAYQAQFVRYGSLVYRFNDPIELGKEILKLDPESTHTAASYVRMTTELLSKMTNGTLEPKSLDEALTGEQTAMEDKRSEPQDEPEKNERQKEEEKDDEEEIPSPEEPIIVDVPTPAADMSTTTPAVLDVLEQATSTPVLEVPEAATTTQEVVSVLKRRAIKKLLS